MNSSTVRVFILFMEGRAINALFGYFSFWHYKSGDFQLILPTTDLEISSFLEYALVVEEHVVPLANLDAIVSNYTLNNTDVNIISEYKRANFIEPSSFFSKLGEGGQRII